MKSEDGTGGRRPLLGDVDCHPPISFEIQQAQPLVVPVYFTYLTAPVS